mgnify:CR=1 FL=1
MKLSKFIVAAALSVALGQTSAANDANPEYKVHKVSRESLALVVSFAGTVSADKTLQLTAQMPGRIAHIAGKEGDAFDSGTVLIELDDTALLARLEAAAASRDAAGADIRNTQVQLQRELYSPQAAPRAAWACRR